MGRGILQLAAQKERRCTPVFVAGAATGVAALAGTAAFVGAGAALFAAREARRVRDAPPAPLYTDDEPADAVQTAAPPGLATIDCGNVAGFVGPLAGNEQDSDLFVMCLRHMLYELKPIFRYCRPGVGMLGAKSSVLISTITERLTRLVGAEFERAQVLCRLIPLLRLRSASPFRRDLKAALQTHLNASPLKLTNRALLATASALVDYMGAFVGKQSTADATKMETIWILRAKHVVGLATGAPFHPEFNQQLSFQLKSLKVRGPELDVAARICGGLYYGPHGASETSPWPSPARGLPSSMSRIEAGLMSALAMGGMAHEWLVAPELLAMAKTKNAGYWRVRDLLLATLVTHHIGYEPEWWGCAFARLVEDLKSNPMVEESTCKRYLGVLLDALVDPLVDATYSPARPVRRGVADAAMAPCPGPYSEVFDSAVRGDPDAFAMLVSVLSGADGAHGAVPLLRAHVAAVLREATGPEYTLCARLCVSINMDVPAREPNGPVTLSGTLARFWYGGGSPVEIEAAMRAVIDGGCADDIESLRALLDPSQDTMVPIPSALVGMGREFVDGKLPDVIKLGVGAFRALKGTTTDLAADRKVLRMVADADMRDTRKPGMFLRRVEELLFALQQVDALEAQLFPEPHALRVPMMTDEYMSRLSYGVLVPIRRRAQEAEEAEEGRALGWRHQVPVRNNNGTWTIGQDRCTYVSDNTVKLGTETVRLGTPSHAQWQHGVGVLRLLAARVLERGCGVTAPSMTP